MPELLNKNISSNLLGWILVFEKKDDFYASINSMLNREMREFLLVVSFFFFKKIENVSVDNARTIGEVMIFLLFSFSFIIDFSQLCADSNN